MQPSVDHYLWSLKMGVALSRASVWFVYWESWKRASLINLTMAHSNKNTHILLTLCNFTLMKTLL